jgi:ankyrin repeat protein
MPDSPTPGLRQLRKRSKELLKAARDGDPHAIERLQLVKPDGDDFRLADAQLAIAREAGFASWPKLVAELEKREIADFVSAVRRGDAPALRRILEASPSVRRRIEAPLFDFGGRAVNAAAGHREMLDVLLDFGADVNARSEWQNGPFGVLDHCDEPTAHYLVQRRGASLTAHAAARLGWFPELRRIVEGNPQAVHEKGADGQRPLHFARTPDIAAYLLDRGADIDARCVDHHSTAAQYALVKRPEVCRLLLDRGAVADIFMAARLGDVDLAIRLIETDPSCLAARVNWPGYPRVPPFNIYCWDLGFLASPHEVASRFGNAAVREVLDAQSPLLVRLLNAAWEGDSQGAHALMASTPDLLGQLRVEHHGLLAQAVHHQRDAAVKLMIELGFDPSAGGVDGGSALHQAAWVGRADYAEAILATPGGRALIDRADPTHSGKPIGWAAYGASARRNEKGDYVRTVTLLMAAGGTFDVERLVGMASGDPDVQAVLRSGAGAT